MEGSLRAIQRAAVGVVDRFGKYPEAPVIGRRIEGAEPASADDGDVLVFHAGTRRIDDGTFETTGGRVVTIVGRGATCPMPASAAYRAVEDVRLEGARYRTMSASYMSTMGRISATKPGDLGMGRTSSAASSIDPASRT